jgi:hypothetical protein
MRGMETRTLKITSQSADRRTRAPQKEAVYQQKVCVPMPTSDSGKAIASRNATTHGLFARDVVLPSLGEDPEGYHQMQDEWTQQLSPRNLLERHYVEKIAAASWRLRRLHRWQAQLFEDDTLTENERIDRLDKVIRHETALQRQIDTAVKMLHKDAPQLYTRRLRDQVLEDMHICERECRDEPETDTMISLETSNRLYQLRKANTQATNELSEAPLDTVLPDFDDNCENELSFGGEDTDETENTLEICENKPVAFALHPGRITEYLDPNHPYRPPTYHGPPGRKGRRALRG